MNNTLRYGLVAAAIGFGLLKDENAAAQNGNAKAPGVVIPLEQATLSHLREDHAAAVLGASSLKHLPVEVIGLRFYTGQAEVYRNDAKDGYTVSTIEKYVEPGPEMREIPNLNSSRITLIKDGDTSILYKKTDFRDNSFTLVSISLPSAESRKRYGVRPDTGIYHTHNSVAYFDYAEKSALQIKNRQYAELERCILALAQGEDHIDEPDPMADKLQYVKGMRVE